jgi:hypothetical protein
MGPQDKDDVRFLSIYYIKWKKLSLPL